MKITYIDLLLWTILCSIHITHTAAIFLPPPSTASPLLVENTQTDCHQQSNGKNKPSPWVSSHHSESLVSFQYWPVSSATTQISWKCDNLCWNIRSDHCFRSFFPYLINSKSQSVSGRTLESLLHIGHHRCGIVPQQGVHGHDDTWRAETALRAMSLCNSFLNDEKKLPLGEIFTKVNTCTSIYCNWSLRKKL